MKLEYSTYGAVKYADVAELADAIDLGSIVNRRAGSSPVIRTGCPEDSGLFCFRSAFFSELYKDINKKAVD